MSGPDRSFEEIVLRLVATAGFESEQARRFVRLVGRPGLDGPIEPAQLAATLAIDPALAASGLACLAPDLVAMNRLAEAPLPGLTRSIAALDGGRAAEMIRGIGSIYRRSPR